MGDKLYRFVAYPSWSLSQDDGKPRQTVELKFVEQDGLAFGYFKDIWQKMCLSVKNYYKIHGITHEVPEWVAWQPYEWSTQKKGVEDRIKLVAWEGRTMAGFLNLRPAFSSQFSPEAQVMYVEHMAAAPSNFKTYLWEKRLSYVGLALLAYASYESQNRGFKGLLGLHAADETALSYYQKVNADFDNNLFYEPVSDVPAPHPVGEKGRAKPYFETRQSGATKLLDTYCDE
jgi:hypothetical protein